MTRTTFFDDGIFSNFYCKSIVNISGVIFYIFADYENKGQKNHWKISLWNYFVNLNQTWQNKSLGDHHSKIYSFGSISIQDGHDYYRRKFLNWTKLLKLKPKSAQILLNEIGGYSKLLFFSVDFCCLWKTAYFGKKSPQLLSQFQPSLAGIVLKWFPFETI